MINSNDSSESSTNIIVYHSMPQAVLARTAGPRPAGGRVAAEAA